MTTTAMQDMLSYIRSTLPMDLDWPRMLEAKAESLLEKEKEQTIGFYAWMSQNDTISNMGQYFHYTNEDMLNEYINQNK